MEKAELKTCPFCGGEAEIFHSLFTAAEYYAMCNKCDARIGVYWTPREAVEAWNRRAKDGASE